MVRPLFILGVLSFALACGSSSEENKLDSQTQKIPLINTQSTPVYDVRCVYNKSFNIVYQGDSSYTNYSSGTIKTAITNNTFTIRYTNSADVRYASYTSSTLLANQMNIILLSSNYVYKLELNEVTYYASQTEKMPDYVKVGDSGVIAVIPIYSGKIINIEYTMVDNTPTGAQYILSFRETTSDGRTIYQETYTFTIINNAVTNIQVDTKNYENNRTSFLAGNAI